MITQKKKSKFKSVVGKIMEPIALGLLALLFIIPTITVINLEPITKNLREFTDVLGVSTSNGVIVDLVGGTHEVVSNEKVYKDGEGVYMYSAKLTKRDADFYSKPILRLENRSDEQKNVSLLGTTILPTNSEIGLIIKDQSYRLQRSSGESNTVDILLRPQARYDVYLTVESLVGVQFAEDFEMKITVK